MARQYIVKKGDTLGKIVKKYYNDTELYKNLAEYNGILNPDLIMLGQAIEIPSKRELISSLSFPKDRVYGLAPPHGLQEILDIFGNIFDFIQEDGNLDERDWESESLTLIQLPFTIPLFWDLSKSAKRLKCQKKLAEIFIEVFDAIVSEGLKDQIKTFGGCYNFRSKRTSAKLSTHSWGIAIDLNPLTNPQGNRGDMSLDIINIFNNFGFKWGGNWSGKSKDPMHFQFCSGY